MKYIIFRQTFMKDHPQAGFPTGFVSAVLMSQGECVADCAQIKWHTIRPNNRWKAGEWFLPRVWSGQPYKSKQQEFCKPLQIAHVHGFRFRRTDSSIHVMIDGEVLAYKGREWIGGIERLANNDGLELPEFLAWFPDTFDGQIISWHPDKLY